MARCQVVPGRSRVRFAAKSSLHPINAEASGVEGFLDADIDEDGAVGGSVSGRIEIKLENVKTGTTLYDRELRKRTDARRFPVISGSLATMAPLGGGRYSIAGDLSFHGVTRAVDGEVELAVAGDCLEIRGTRVFDIRDFNLEPPKLLRLKVHPEITVHLELVLRAAT